MWIFRPFRSRNLSDVIGQTKKIKVMGVKFVIKKLDPIDTMNGSRVLQKQFDTYEVEKKPDVPQNPEKIKTYFRDLFMACIVEPKLYRDQAEAIEKRGVWVDGLLTDLELIDGLHTAILEFTYGKKKLKSHGLQSRT